MFKGLAPALNALLGIGLYLGVGFLMLQHDGITVFDPHSIKLWATLLGWPLIALMVVGKGVGIFLLWVIVIVVACLAGFFFYIWLLHERDKRRERKETKRRAAARLRKAAGLEGDDQ